MNTVSDQTPGVNDFSPSAEDLTLLDFAEKVEDFLLTYDHRFRFRGNDVAYWLCDRPNPYAFPRLRDDRKRPPEKLFTVLKALCQKAYEITFASEFVKRNDFKHSAGGWWVKVSSKEITSWTRCTPSQWKTAKQYLILKGLLRIKRASIPGRSGFRGSVIWLQIDFDRLEEVFENIDSWKTALPENLVEKLKDAPPGGAAINRHRSITVKGGAVGVRPSSSPPDSPTSHVEVCQTIPQGNKDNDRVGGAAPGVVISEKDKDPNCPMPVQGPAEPDDITSACEAGTRTVERQAKISASPDGNDGAPQEEILGDKSRKEGSAKSQKDEARESRRQTRFSGKLDPEGQRIIEMLEEQYQDGEQEVTRLLARQIQQLRFNLTANLCMTQGRVASFFSIANNGLLDDPDTWLAGLKLAEILRKPNWIRIARAVARYEHGDAKDTAWDLQSLIGMAKAAERLLEEVSTPGFIEKLQSQWPSAGIGDPKYRDSECFLAARAEAHLKLFLYGCRHRWQEDILQVVRQKAKAAILHPAFAIYFHFTEPVLHWADGLGLSEVEVARVELTARKQLRQLRIETKRAIKARVFNDEEAQELRRIFSSL